MFFAGRDRHLDIWCMGYSPINLPILSKLLSVYPDREAADILYNGTALKPSFLIITTALSKDEY
jgi:hypothetical protein